MSTNLVTNKRWESIRADDLVLHSIALMRGFADDRGVNDTTLVSSIVGGLSDNELYVYLSRVAVVSATIEQSLPALATNNRKAFWEIFKKYRTEVTEKLGTVISDHIYSTDTLPTDEEWQHALWELTVGLLDKFLDTCSKPRAEICENIMNDIRKRSIHSIAGGCFVVYKEDPPVSEDGTPDGDDEVRFGCECNIVYTGSPTVSEDGQLMEKQND